MSDPAAGQSPGLAELQARCYVPRIVTIAGRRLGPFTLGHALALEVLGQSALEGDDFPGFLMALEVCRRSPERAVADFARPWVRVRLHLRALWLITRRGPDWFRREIAAFREHCDYWGQLPEQIRDDEAGADSDPAAGGPFLEHVLVSLMARLGYSERDALRLPLGKAVLRYFVFWESEGRVKLRNQAGDDHARELMRQADENHAATLAAANARLTGTPAAARN